MLMNSKRENFKRISENRTSKIIDLISKLHNLTNSSFYEYTDEEIDNIFRLIQNELNKQKNIFIAERKRENKKVEL